MPYRYCWIEPHYGIPFFPIYPYSWKVFLIKTLNLSNQRGEVIKDYKFISKHYHWPSRRKLKEIFPDSKIYLCPTLETIAIIKKFKKMISET